MTAPSQPAIAHRFVVDPNDQATPEAEDRAYDYEAVSAMMSRSKEYELVNVEYIDNPLLRQAFEATRERFDAEGKNTEEILVFHGTLHENIESIVSRGFKIGGKGDQDSRFVDKSLGHGIYTARHLPSAAMYSSKSVGPDGLIRVIGLVAVRGAIAKPQLGARKAKNAVPLEMADSFDNDEWLVLYKAEQTLPCYIVSLKPKPKNGGSRK